MDASSASPVIAFCQSNRALTFPPESKPERGPFAILFISEIQKQTVVEGLKHGINKTEKKGDNMDEPLRISKRLPNVRSLCKSGLGCRLLFSQPVRFGA